MGGYIQFTPTTGEDRQGLHPSGRRRSRRGFKEKTDVPKIAAAHRCHRCADRRIPATAQAAAPIASPAIAAAQVHYRSAIVDGTKIFYREAGPKDAPTLLLLHGFPTSSQMFRNLIPLLSDRYHIVAPDYPGFRP